MMKGVGFGMVLAVGVLVGACTDQPATSDTAQMLSQGPTMPNNVPVPNATGFTSTVSTSGQIDLQNEFFQDLGTNGRRCVTCHLPTAGWGTTPQITTRTY